MLHETDKRDGPLRIICLLCGKEIHGPALPELEGRTAPLVSGEAVSVLTYRNGAADASGFAHKECAGGETVHDLTGKPQYAGYNEDNAKPAYAEQQLARVANEKSGDD